MNIKTTSFEFEHHYSKQAGNSTLGYYVFHSVTAYNSIIIDDVEYTACYQTGDINYYYDCPSNILKLTDYSTSELLILIQEWAINNIYWTDNKCDLSEIKEIQKLCPTLDSVEKINRVWQVLHDNGPSLSDFIDLDIYTDNLDDYNEDVEGRLTLKQTGE